MVVVWVVGTRGAGEEIRVAAASNFAGAMKAVAGHFEARTGHTVTPVFGATGTQYAQIVNGAPFAVFFAADVDRPARLEAAGLAVPGSRFTYARGRLVLWSRRPDYVDDGGKVLRAGNFRHLAIANPKLAPYGGAARAVLQARGHWAALRRKLVRGENIAQAFQFVMSGNAELGFVAWAQVMRPGQPLEGSHWMVPQALYPPIEQQAVLLREVPSARALLDFVRTSEARRVIREYGYDTP